MGERIWESFEGQYIEWERVYGYMGRVFGKYIEWDRESICVNRLIPVAGPLLVVY